MSGMIVRYRMLGMVSVVVMLVMFMVCGCHCVLLSLKTLGGYTSDEDIPSLLGAL
jgi:hypothetical protein